VEQLGIPRRHHHRRAGRQFWAGERLDTFVKGADNALWHKWFAGGWSDWESLGGIIDNEPAATTWSTGAMVKAPTGAKAGDMPTGKMK